VLAREENKNKRKGKKKKKKGKKKKKKAQKKRAVTWRIIGELEFMRI